MPTFTPHSPLHASPPSLPSLLPVRCPTCSRPACAALAYLTSLPTYFTLLPTAYLLYLASVRKQGHGREVGRAGTAQTARRPVDHWWIRVGTSTLDTLGTYYPTARWMLIAGPRQTLIDLGSRGR